jgi:site-specific DNA recombinase
MTTPRAAAIYARISLDVEGTGKGVERQTEDCRKLATELGWPVADEYVDNDISASAYSTKRRPEYQRMLADIGSGTIDAVLVYNLDRLTRRPVEFEDSYSILASAGVTNVRFVTGDMDFGTQDGLLIGRIHSAVATNASGKTSERILRKLEQVAAEGRPHGGSQRPFGFEDDKITHNKTEARIIRQLAARYLAGESLRSLTTWLHEKEIPTVTGGDWHTHTLRQMLMAPRTAGLRQHRGEIVAKATWKPIISPADRDRILALHESKRRSGRRAGRRYLLSGQLRCGRCENVLYSAARKTTRRYVCASGPDHGGCGKLTVVALPVEELVAEAVLLRLDTPQLADALAGREHAGADTAHLAAAIDDDRGQLAELAGLYADKKITASEWLTARDQIESRMRKLQKRLAHLSSHSDLAAVIGQGAALHSQWSGLNLDRQAAIIRTVVSYVTILPGTRGAHALDPSRVLPVWSL